MPVTVGYVQRRTGMSEHRARAVRNDLVRSGRQLFLKVSYAFQR